MTPHASHAPHVYIVDDDDGIHVGSPDTACEHHGAGDGALTLAGAAPDMPASIGDSGQQRRRRRMQPARPEAGHGAVDHRLEGVGAPHRRR